MLKIEIVPYIPLSCIAVMSFVFDLPVFGFQVFVDPDHGSDLSIVLETVSGEYRSEVGRGSYRVEGCGVGFLDQHNVVFLTYLLV